MEQPISSPAAPSSEPTPVQAAERGGETPAARVCDFAAAGPAYSSGDDPDGKNPNGKFPDGNFPPSGPHNRLPFAVDTDRMLSLALRISASMLESGADIHRVEDTMERICRAYGAVEVQAFSIPSLVAATVTMGDGYHKTEVRRVYSIANRYDLLENLNALSRQICAVPVDLDRLEEAYRKALIPDRRPKWLLMLCGIIAAAGFTYFFGGNWRDALAALPVGALITLFDLYKPARLNALAHTVIVSIAAGILCILTAKIGLASHVDKVMIGGIMLLIPGLVFSASIRELLCGDIIAGTLRMIQALLTAVVIAAGFAVAMLVGGLIL